MHEFLLRRLPVNHSLFRTLTRWSSSTSKSITIGGACTRGSGIYLPRHLTHAKRFNGVSVNSGQHQYKAGQIHRPPWKNREAVELATLQRVNWFNHQRLLGSTGHILPAEATANFYRQQAGQAMAALNEMAPTNPGAIHRVLFSENGIYTPLHLRNANMPIRLTPYVFNVDIVGTCNLRCPSCPIGNTNSHMLPGGAMAIDKLDSIVKKAKRELGYVSFHLYNWTEPFIHPKIGAAIEAVKRNGVACHLSTNLNLDKHLAEVAEAAPTSIRVSTSGFTQEIYSQTHKEGDIEKVKINMEKLSSLVKQNGGMTELNVLFHRYLGNHEDEAQMRLFAEQLGYTFEAVWAYLMPLEKNIAFAENGLNSPFLSDSDINLIEKLALPIGESIAVAKTKRTRDCILRSQQYALDSDGNVSLCCAVYNSNERIVGNYLADPHEVLLAKKYENPICKTCMKHGLHVLFTYGAPKEFDELAVNNIHKHYPSAALTASLPNKRLDLIKKINRTIKRHFQAR